MRRPYVKQSTYNIMSYWNLLPEELQSYIREIAVAPIIQKIWRGRSDCKRYALNIARKYADPEWNQSGGRYWGVDPMHPETPTEIEYCAKHAWFCEKMWLWEDFIVTIEHSLWKDEYSGGRGAEFYHRTKKATEMLKERFQVACVGKRSTYWDASTRYWDAEGRLWDAEGMLWEPAAPAHYE